MAVTTQQQIAAAYVAFFNRAPDLDGLNFWETEASNSGLNDLELMRDIAAGFAQHPSFESLYGGLGNAAFIDAIYLNIGGAPADANGKAHWLGLIESGELSRSDFVADFVYGLLTITPETLDGLVTSGEITEQEKTDALLRQDRLTNKSAVALNFTQEMGDASNLSPGTDPLDPASLAEDPVYQASQAIIAGVTEDDATMDAPNAYLVGSPTIDGILEEFGDTSEVPGQTFTLTSGTDAIPGLLGSAGTGSNAGNDVIVGSSGTYNSGDELDGGEGRDTLQLDLVSNPVPYDVGNVNNVEELFVNTTESGADGADDVVLLMSNFNGLEQLTIEQSRADINVQDLQNDVDVVIDDMRGDVELNIDAQNAMGADDALNVSIREFGDSAGGIAGDRDLADAAAGDTDGATGTADNADPATTAGDYGSYGSDLTIDEAIEIVNLTDNGAAGFESDLSIAGGFRQLNIDGGQAGVALTVHDVASSAFGEDGVTVDATGFAGDLAIDADAVDVLNTGAGDDTITTDMAYGGDIDAGNGDNLVIIGSAIGEDDADDDLLAGASVTTGSGSDTVLVDDDAAGSITTGAGDDEVEIGAIAGEDDWSDLEETGLINTGAGADSVTIGNDAAGTIDTGTADDSVADGDDVNVADDVEASGTITTGAGADSVTIGDTMSGTITTGSENDSVTVGEDVDGAWNDLATITTEAGDDVVGVWGTLRDNGVINTGEGNDFVVIAGGVENAQDPFAPEPVDSDARVDLGAGNDELVVEGDLNGDVLAGTGDDDLVVIEGDIGNNATTVAAIDGGEGADSLTLADWGWDGEDATDITVTDAYADITGIETLNLIDDAASGEDDFNVDLAAFDGDLANVNIAKFGAGNSETNLDNVAGETITISAEDNVTETDVTLNVTSADASLTVVLASDIDGDIVDGGEFNGPVAEGNTDFDVVLDDGNGSIGALNLVNNGTAINELGDDDKGRTVALDGGDFAGTLTITGDMANDREGYAEGDVRLRNQQDGNLLAVTGIAAATIEAGTYAGDLNLTLAADQSYDITLGSGDDVVNMEGDDLDVGDVVAFGAGIDRLIVDETTQSTGDDSDEVFGHLTGLEELEVRGDAADGRLEVSLDDDAFRSDLARVIVAAGEDDANVLLDIGADFVDDDTDEGRDLRIDADNGVLEVNNDSINNLDLYTDASTGGRDILISQNDGGVIDVSIGIDAGEDADIGAGATEGTLDAGFGYGNNGEVELDLAAGTISTITLLDNGAGENGDINLVVAANWANTALSIDASAITDDDIDNDTGGLTLDASAEADAVLTIDGTQNDDDIIGGQQGDVINGNAGDDDIEGDVTVEQLQITTVTFAASYDIGDAVTVTVDETDYTYTNNTAGTVTGDTVALAIEALIDADVEAPATTVVAGAALTLTGIVAGEAFTVTTGSDNSAQEAATPVIQTITPVSLASGGEYLQLSINGVTYTSSALVTDNNVTRSDDGADPITITFDATYDVGDVIGFQIDDDSLDSLVQFNYTVNATDGVNASDFLDNVKALIDATYAATLTTTVVGDTIVLSGSPSGNIHVHSLQVTDVAGLTTLAELLDDFVTTHGAAIGAATGGTLSSDGTSLLLSGPVDGSDLDQTASFGTVLTDGTPSGSVTLSYAAATGLPTDQTDPTVETTQEAIDFLGGADTIDGGEGDNAIYGMVGDDVITAGDGDNFVDGGDGNDTITLGNGANEAYGADGNDTIVAGGILGQEGTWAIGGLGSDTITLGDGDNTVYGDEYDESELGGADTIVTGNGDDLIYGDFGGDQITANGGSDVFAYMLTTDSTGADLGFDTINGFTVAADAFDLSWLAANLGFTGGVDFLGNFDNENTANSAIAATSTTALEVVYVEYQSGDGEGYVYADTNASGDIDTSDLVIKIVGLDGALGDGNFTSYFS